jgi:hypothetical protein
MTSTLKFTQINLQHSKVASLSLRRYIDVLHTSTIALIQEPYYFKGIKGLCRKSGRVFSAIDDGRSRACIYVTNDIDATYFPQFSTSDFVAILLKYKTKGSTQKFICCSCYLPYDSITPPASKELCNLVTYSTDCGLPLIVGCDANAHH